MSENAFYSNEDAERAVITTLIYFPYLYEQVGLKPADFTNKTLRRVFDVIGDMRAHNQEIDFVTLAARIGMVDSDWVKSIMIPEVTPDALPQYVDAVLRAYIRTDLEKALIRAQTLIRGGFDIPTTELVACVVKEVESVRQPTPKEKSIIDVADEMLENVERMFDHENETYGLSTGLKDLDKITFGLVKGETTIYAGIPGCGKSSLAAQIATHVALQHRKTAIIFSMEMLAREYMLRMVMQQCQLDSRLLKTGKYKKYGKEYDAIHRSAEIIKNAPIKIVDTLPQTCATMRGKIAEEVNTSEVGVVIVDYTELVEEPQIRDDVERTKFVTRSIKNMGRKYEVPVVALAAINRDKSAVGAQKLRNGGDYEADIVALLEVESERLDDFAKIGIVKHRNGKTTTIPINFNAPTTTWRDMVVIEGV